MVIIDAYVGGEEEAAAGGNRGRRFQGIKAESKEKL